MTYMLRSAPVLRAGLRACVQSPAASIISRSVMSGTRVVRDEKHVNVVTYKDGERAQETISVTSSSEPVTPPGQDIEVAAQPLNPALLKQMSPTMQKFTLFGKTAVITGYDLTHISISSLILLTVTDSGGRGLGYNMAQALSEVGIKGIAILDVQQELGEKSARELSSQTGVDVRFYKVDVRDAQAIQKTIQDVAEHYGEINILINAAGIAE